MPIEYKTLNVVGRGMTSQVYKGQDPSGRVVAIKELLPAHRSDPKRLKTLEQEVEILRGIKHPNTVALLDYDRARYRMVLEFMPRSLRYVIAKEPFHYARRLKWALEVTEALVHLHTLRIIHKDVKPENIFISEDGHAKLSDFGFAEREEGLLGFLQSLFGKRRIQGTISYLSPEQVKQRPLSTKSDIFSWGVVLYELFTGTRPFRSSQEQVSGGGGASADAAAVEIVKQIVRADPKPPRDLNGELDREIEQLILHCLSRRPANRPSALNIKVTLQRVIGKLR